MSARRPFWTGLCVVCAALMVGAMTGGCPFPFDLDPNTPAGDPNTPDADPNDEPNTPADTGFANTTDKTNAGAKYVGSTACQQCHTQIAEWQTEHGHAYKLNRIEGQAPEYPAAGVRAGVPAPPEGFEWTDVAYVIGGYTKKARYIDHDGYILITGIEGIPTQWNLDFPPNGTTAGFVNYEAERETPKPYDYSCFVCHTTGALPQDEDFPEYEEGRPGFAGSFEEPGIQCEACHGPGGGHFTTSGDEVVIDKSAIFVDLTGTDSCKQCHNRPYDSQDGKILSSGGYVQHHEQGPELAASGGHATFSCTTCHDPHRSAVYDAENAIRKSCTDCHADATMARHDGKIYTRGDGYTETLSCESCHMPYATKSGSANTFGSGRIGDTRTHIFRISTEADDYTSFFSDDGSEVRRDSSGRAAVTVDFVCLRCHNDAEGSTIFSLTVDRAAEIAASVHTTVAP